ncbi:MAG: TolB family protein [Sodaliphilus sp.]
MKHFFQIPKAITLCALCAALLAPVARAQKFEVTQVKQVPTASKVYHPIFVPGSNQILVSGEDYSGLGVINLADNSYKSLIEGRAAGYMPAITDDGQTVVCRTLNDATMELSLHAINIQSGEASTVAEHLDHFNHINLSDDQAQMGMEGEQVSRRAVKRQKANNIFVTEEDLKLVLYNNGTRTVVDPLSTPERDVNYCWSSISPDKTHLLFVAGNDAYVSNLDGSGLVNLGPLHAPVWRGNDYIVAMEDHDDGTVYTSSEIVIVGADGTNRQQLSTTSSEIKMFPAVSEDGTQVAYHSTEGNIYVMTIQEK